MGSFLTYMIMHTYTAVGLLLLLGCMACHPLVSKMSGTMEDSTAAAHQRKDTVIQPEGMSAPPPAPKMILYDLDLDSKLDTIRLSTTGKNGHFYCVDEVSFSLTGGGEKAFTDGCWESINRDFLKENHNEVASDDVFIYKKKKKVWVLLFGAWDASSTAPMSVIRIRDQQPEMILNEEIDYPQHIGDDNAQHQVLLIGKGISERDGTYDSLQAPIYSYDPYYVYNLEGDGKIDSVFMEQYNRTHYVWAGWEYGANTRVVLYNNGQRQLIRK